MASKVYFADFSCKKENIPEKFRRLLITAGIKDIDFEKKFACIKLHMGEPANMPISVPSTPRLWPISSRSWAASPSCPMPTPCMLAAARTLWSIWTPPMKTASPPSPPAAM